MKTFNTQMKKGELVTMEEAAKLLGFAIIKEATIDYLKILCNKRKETPTRNKEELEEFFRSEWFENLAEGADGNRYIHLLEDLARDKGYDWKRIAESLGIKGKKI